MLHTLWQRFCRFRLYWYQRLFILLVLIGGTLWIQQPMDALDRHHDILISSITPTPDSQYLAVQAKGLRLYSPDGRTMLRELPVNIGHIAYSPDGGLIAGRIVSGEAVSIYRASDGVRLHQLGNFPSGSLEHMIWSPDSRTLVTLEFPTRQQREFVFWDVTTGTQVPAPFPIPLDTNDIAFTPDGTRVVCATQNGLVVLGLPNGQPIARYSLPLGRLTMLSNGEAVIVRRTNALRLVRIADGTVLWEVVNSDQEPRLSRVRHFAWAGGDMRIIALSLDQEYLVASFTESNSSWGLFGSGGSELILVRLRDGAIVRKYRGEPSAINAVGFAPDGKTFLTASIQGQLARWAVAPLPSWIAWLPFGGLILLLGQWLLQAWEHRWSNP